jgi:hypothetical protein
MFLGFFHLFNNFCPNIFVVKFQSSGVKRFIFFLISSIKSLEFLNISFAHLIANKNSFFFSSDK